MMAAMALIGISTMSGDDYVVTGGSSRLYDEANMKSTPTRNMSDEEIALLPGMAFKVTTKSSGWSQVMYSPGIRAFILDTTLSESEALGNPVAGEYKVTNNPDKKAKVTNNGDNWNISIGGESFPGKCYGKIVVFFDKSGNQKYTLVKLNGESNLHDYDNAVTKFF